MNLLVFFSYRYLAFIYLSINNHFFIESSVQSSFHMLLNMMLLQRVHTPGLPCMSTVCCIRVNRLAFWYNLENTPLQSPPLFIPPCASWFCYCCMLKQPIAWGFVFSLFPPQFSRTCVFMLTDLLKNNAERYIGFLSV